jgi:mannose/cellobiose epimerase-like protein (N-acyl-D-glucosamine 2-epimerase family)
MPDNNAQDWAEISGPKFAVREGHRQWLQKQAASLFDFFEPHVIDPTGGFHTMDDIGQPLPPAPGHDGCERQLHETTRMVHCFAIGKLIGRPNAGDFIDHGMDFLWTRHRDMKHGGYYWGVDDSSATNPIKQAYGHAFVLLAGASAKVAGHPDADRLIEDITDVLLRRFWEPKNGATSEEYSADWQTISNYRGQNSNMHLTEALMAAYEATEDQNYLNMAESIAELIIHRHAREQGWRVAEHFDADWQVDRTYAGDPMLRPAGTTPGHALEWTRLLIQLWDLGGRQKKWMCEAAKGLFTNAIDTGWSDKNGGFYYTLDWNNDPDRADRFWWVCAEGIGAASALGSVQDDPLFEIWYRRIWGFVDSHVIDHKHGGWIPELDSELRRINQVFIGKPDLYHSLQACLLPLAKGGGSITRGLQINTGKN